MQLDLTYWSGSSRWPQAVCVRVEYIFNMFDFIALKDEKKIHVKAIPSNNRARV